LAEVLQLALDSDGPLDRSQYPENQARRTDGQGGADTARMGRLAGVGLMLGAMATAWMLRRRR
ncbi:MAG: hypothetical protein AB7P40_20285, partial [Chloroflexota bacterium]